MGCSEGYVNNACSTRQNFCSIIGQTVQANTGIDRTLSSITKDETIITNDIWNRIYQVLKNIYNYGNRGQRNPYILNDDKSLKFSNVNDGDEVLQSLYNQIINFISTNQTISNQPHISKELMDKIQTTINSYKLNFDRCNSCNTTCNTTCQAAWQCGCCDDGQQHCEGQWGGGGGGGSSLCTAYWEYHHGCNQTQGYVG